MSHGDTLLPFRRIVKVIASTADVKFAAYAKGYKNPLGLFSSILRSFIRFKASSCLKIS